MQYHIKTLNFFIKIQIFDITLLRKEKRSIIFLVLLIDFIVELIHELISGVYADHVGFFYVFGWTQRLSGLMG
jgi:hypothetical protein